jgi:phosphoglycolate phosphatase-like HAD superfamily hydrolase
MERKFMVIHDWNGCLLDDVSHRFEHGPRAIFRHYGLPEPSLEDYCQHITSDFMAYYYSRGFVGTGDKKRDGDTLNGIMTANMANATMPPLFPETTEFLESLRSAGMIQTIVSGMEDREFRRQVGHHKLEHFFHDMHGGIRGKSATFRGILAKYAIEPLHAVGITDTMSDARELAEVGVLPILIPRGYCVPDMTAVPTMIVVQNLREALTVIQR